MMLLSGVGYSPSGRNLNASLISSCNMEEEMT